MPANVSLPLYIPLSVPFEDRRRYSTSLVSESNENAVDPVDFDGQPPKWSEHAPGKVV